MQFPRNTSNIAINVLPSCDGYHIYLETSELVPKSKSCSIFIGIVKIFSVFVRDT